MTQYSNGSALPFLLWHQISSSACFSSEMKSVSLDVCSNNNKNNQKLRHLLKTAQILLIQVATQLSSGGGPLKGFFPSTLGRKRIPGTEGIFHKDSDCFTHHASAVIDDDMGNGKSLIGRCSKFQNATENHSIK